MPGAESVMPPLFPRALRKAGDKVMRFFRDRGVRAPHIAEMWKAYASLTETPNRQAFVRTVRAVIDPGGQTVSSRDRLYLAASVPTLIVWGDRDDIIPVEHAHATHALFVALYRLASRTKPERVRVPRERIAALSRAYRSRVDARVNDGMVPTHSQVWGDTIRAVWADHHDVIGHFHHPTHVPPHFDWLASGTGFTRPQFGATWRDVAAFVAQATRG